MRRWLAPVAVATLAAGCVTHVPVGADYRGPVSLPAALVAPLEAEAGAEVAVVTETVRKRPDFIVRQVELVPGPAAETPIEFEYYEVRADAPTPVIVLLPIFNGQLSITRYFARYFANQGWRAVVVTRKRDPLEQIDDVEDIIRANLDDYRRVLDWVEEQHDIDPTRVGVFGISLGAMDAVMLTALDRRIDALVAAMAGGDLAQLMMDTRYRRVARTVDRMLDEGGTTREGLLESMEQRIAIDPLTLAPYVDAQRVLLVMTRTDAIVPFELQDELRESMGEPETLYLPTGHRSSVVYFPLLRNSAFEFFERQFRGEFIAAR
ncbi:MAG TPA: alpha/beta fold hydrolase [Gammaproteobacteria bacterium]|nr:alpha/beta fold hydrolase [Gammaproteobacteria bacterium]